ncbi:alpha/beta hydrolase [Frondihabitans sucicola]|uniref:Alpha/beta hydrolase n=1 Tax=Frondihabitans sucicola TaxID=1268041 RepID=A0ABM8GMH9_9MICO|nr:alpha/beta hydrolase [Frondihabitans sucicola]BDZ49596.1 alpha/beta hydrolase [Frondihabitans sucicola]
MPLITTTSGTDLFYESIGDATRPPLLLIQGLGAQMIGWTPEFCRQLAEAGFHVVRFDNRDAGESQKFEGVDYTLTDMADDTAGLLDALGIPAAHIVGQSMGGMIAQELAAGHPEKILTLDLLYTSASPSFILSRAIERSEAVVIPTDRAAFIEAYLSNEYLCRSRDYPQDIAWLRELGGHAFDRDPRQSGLQRQTDAVLHSRERGDLVRTITAPTAILVGDSDQLIDPAASQDLHDRIAGSSLRVFPGMGHEVPAALFREIVADIVANAGRIGAPESIPKEAVR